MLSLDLPLRFFKCIDMLLRGFLVSLHGSSERTACGVVAAYGLGIKNLRLLNLALHMR
jgi:hypothetical protein